MKRRTFLKIAPLTALAPAALVALSMEDAAAKTSEKVSAGASGSGKPVPDWAKSMRESDMLGIGPDGKPDPDYKATGSGVTPTRTAYDPSQPRHQMKLTREEQAILDGKKGEVLAKVMRTVVDHGNLFGAEKLVDLGGAPHSALFTGTPSMAPLVKILTDCADAGLKSYAPYTINPRPFDLYNVQTEADEQIMIFEGYPLQPEVDHLHARLGGRGLETRSCTCFLPEIGNAPEPGTFVAWAESSAVNYGNSVLGIRSNRNSCGMELMCALVGKAPYFGLMTDEGGRFSVEIQPGYVSVFTTPERETAGVGAPIVSTEEVQVLPGQTAVGVFHLVHVRMRVRFLEHDGTPATERYFSVSGGRACSIGVSGRRRGFVRRSC